MRESISDNHASEVPTDQIAAKIFNGYLASHAVHVLDECGLTDSLMTGLDPEAAEGRLDAKALSIVLDILRDQGIAARHADKYVLTREGQQVFRNVGFFTWAIGGYGSYFRSLPDIVRGAACPARNDADVARGCGQVDSAMMRDGVHQVLAGLRPGRIADLGCGDATRLVSYLGRDTSVRGVGVERSEASALMARRRIEEAGLSHRVDIIAADCLSDLGPRRHEDVDVVMSFFLLHDLLAAQDGSFETVAARIRRNFPEAHHYLFADTTSDEAFAPSAEAPIFIRAFQLVHGIMGIPLRTRAEYESLLVTEHTSVESVIELAVPNSFLFVLRAMKPK